MIARDKERKILKIRFWKFEITIQEQEKCYLGNWKFGGKLVGSFTKIK
jgi:hypothetical protein